MKLTVYNENAVKLAVKCDLILTDPPYELSPDVIKSVLDNTDCNHAVMLLTMSQVIELMRIATEWELCFDFVFDNVQPRKSMSKHTPHYTHSTGIYIKKHGVKSIFDRRLTARSDSFLASSYWPTIFRANRERSNEHSHAKNLEAWTTLMSSFHITTMFDPFCGSGTSIRAAISNSIDCIANDIDSQCVRSYIDIANFFRSGIIKNMKNHKTDYRKNKTQVLGRYLSSDDAEIVQKALDLASEKTGVTNNRKNRISLLEICKSYIDNHK